VTRSVPETNECRAVAEDRALATIDAALAGATHRGAYASADALNLLSDVLATIEYPDHVDAAVAVVEEVFTAFDGQALVDRSRVVDALLDLRLALEPVPALV